MKILFLSPHLHLIKFLEAQEDKVVQFEDKIDENFAQSFDWIISYGYRHIIKKAVIDAVNGRIINLHISYLPWNRGADPNLWSFLENTPKGVTIHYVDEGLDTGKIIAQRLIEFKGPHTLATTYRQLTLYIESYFKSLWPLIRTGNVMGIEQNPQDGSYHKSKDKDPFMHLLTNGWDTSIEDLIKRS